MSSVTARCIYTLYRLLQFHCKNVVDCAIYTVHYFVTDKLTAHRMYKVADVSKSNVKEQLGSNAAISNVPPSFKYRPIPCASCVDPAEM